MQDRPTAEELLRDIAELLEGEALQATAGALQHKLRVAGNLCRILEREAATGPLHDKREVELLSGLLGQAADGRDSKALSQAVTQRLDAGPNAEFEREVWRAALEIVRGKLFIAKPGHDTYDFAGEQKP